MRSLFKNLHNAVTQASLHTSSQTNKWLIMDKQLLSKKDDQKSFCPIIRPVVSTTAEPLSDDDTNVYDEEEDDVFSCPLYSGGYKNIDYSKHDRHVSKKCKFSNRY